MGTAIVAAMLAPAPLTPANADYAGPFTVTIEAPGGTHAYGDVVTATVTVLNNSGQPVPDVDLQILSESGWCNDEPTGRTGASGTAAIAVTLFCRQDLYAEASSTDIGLLQDSNQVHEEVTLPLTLTVPSAKRPFWAVHATVGGMDHLYRGHYADRSGLVLQRQSSTGWQTLTGMPTLSEFGQDPLTWDAHPGHHLLRVVYVGDDRGDGWAPSASEPVDFVVGTGTVPSWLKQLNHYRQLGGLPMVGEDPYKDAADRQHISYMVKNDYYGHDEDQSNRYFTTAGNDGGTHSDLYKGISCAQAIPGWLVTPFHGRPMLDQTVYTMGFDCEKGYAALYVYDDTQSATPASYPQTWPVDGGKMPLHRFGGGEIPNPLDHCPARWTRRRDANVGMGAALFAFTAQQMKNLKAELNDNGQATPVCAFREYKTVYLLPLYPLKGGHDYEVKLSSAAGNLSWAFRA